ncbi:unnamed protein product [Fusarium venenatum]|uniref:Uncharacterized protein n=1 Tax=Fusarium venenatum TaxID=56646 RepID=A0A2L2TTJ6_9HYPO|nr:uncharacterized protein FVRRES_07841 [Fusarium venenatum]CEI63405.1 unnamed protein product [Fusarium venenatum]
MSSRIGVSDFRNAVTSKCPKAQASKTTLPRLVYLRKIDTGP